MHAIRSPFIKKGKGDLTKWEITGIAQFVIKKNEKWQKPRLQKKKRKEKENKYLQKYKWFF